MHKVRQSPESRESAWQLYERLRVWVPREPSRVVSVSIAGFRAIANSESSVVVVG